MACADELVLQRAIADNGTAMEAQPLQHVFDPFLAAKPDRIGLPEAP